MKATFENSVSVLVRAYMNDTLISADCQKCAVGNLIASAHGKVSHLWYQSLHGGPSAFVGCTNGGKIMPWADSLDEITATGYTAGDLLRIETVFMCGVWGDFQASKADNFLGLMAVVDVLADIHNVDLSIKETAIGQFKEVQALKLETV